MKKHIHDNETIRDKDKFNQFISKVEDKRNKKNDSNVVFDIKT